jgi:uncharacterized membrane protein
MPLTSRLKAFFAYLFLAVGGIVILAISRNDRFAAFHARQSVAITLVAIIGSAVLTGICYLIAMIPSVGAVLASASFALVICLLLAMLYAWIAGMINALRANFVSAPFVGGFAARWLRTSS